MKKQEKNNYKRTLHYFWQALMTQKLRTVLLLVLMPVYIFIGSVIWPRGTSDIIGMLSSGDFDIANYTGVLLFTILPMAFNNLVLVRILDFLDWSLDAKCGKYLSELAFNAVINQSMTFHADHFSGSLTSQANKLPGAFIDLKSMFVWNMLPLILRTSYSLIAAMVISPAFGAILFISMAAYTVVSIVTYYKTRDVDENLAEAENKQTGQLADAVTNVLNVKSYAREGFERKRFERATDRTERATFKVARTSFMRNMLMNVVGTTTFIVVLVLLIMSRDLFGLDIANMVFLFSLTSTLLSNAWELNHVLRSLNRAFGNAKEMVEILDLPYIIDDKTDRPLEIHEAGIEVSHIMFQHKEKKTPLFEDFSLNVPAGKSLGLVGVSGSGKTTLTKLLLRFDDVGKGAIFIDGQDIRDVTQKSLREAIAYVPQESSLFHRSVYENIAYGKPGATLEEVKEAARLANADEFIRDLPDGYDTMVGERGVKLSGGQRQRIAIARAILKDAPILVLDEATSALDSESEAAIQEALANLMRGRTSIVVAHRLSTVAGLDKIVVLSNGKIMEEGAHQELLARKDGEYAKLWNRQSGGFIAAKF